MAPVLGSLRFGALAVVASVACGRGSGASSKRDTVTVAPAAPSVDTIHHQGAAGVPAAPPDSLPPITSLPDSGEVLTFPAQPQRGGALFALAQGVASELPQCSWQGDPIPCYRAAGGVRVMVPLPADEPAGVYTLTVERPTGRITRHVQIADRAFGRELVFLDSAHYALVMRRDDIIRDARALRQLLSTVSPVQRWKGGWKQPLSGGSATPYGVERFYFRASDSTRVVTLTPALATHGSFATDTSARNPSDIPGWRHDGVDIAVPRGSAVRAPAAGVVIDVGDYVLPGRTVIIDHGQGVHSVYFHLDTALVQKGDVIRPGELLARVGDSGLATSPQLHYGIYIGGRAVDPAVMRNVPGWVRGDSVSSVPVQRTGTRPRQ